MKTILTILVLALVVLDSGCQRVIDSASPGSDGGSGDQKPAGTIAPPTPTPTPQPTGKVSLQWKANPGEQTTFELEQSRDGTTFSRIQTIPDGTTTAVVSNLASGPYYFRVRGTNAAGSSAYAQTLTVQVP